MAISLEQADAELERAVKLPPAEVFHEVVAISEELREAGHPDASIASWSERAAAEILRLGISPGSMIHPDTLEPARSALIFNASDVEFEDLGPVTSLRSLLVVTLGKARIDWSAMPPCEWPHLQKVYCRRGPGIDAGLFAWLSRQALPSLRELHAADSGMTTADHHALLDSSFWPQLEVVALSKNALGAGPAPWPERLDRMRELALARVGYDDAGIARLCRAPLPALERLDVSGNDFGLEGLAAIAGAVMPALESLVARNTALSSQPIWEVLAGSFWPRLRHLNIAGDGRDPGEVVKAQNTLAPLVSLDLSSSQLGDEGVTALGRVSFSRLESLVLAYNGTGPLGARALSACRLPDLADLDLSVNPLGDVGVRALAEASWWPRLRTLTLANVGMTAAGIRNLAAAVPPGIQVIDLGDLRPFDTDAVALLRAAIPPGAKLA
jgi:hypothetical protein